MVVYLAERGLLLLPAVQVGRLLKLSCKADLQKAEAAAKYDGFLLMDASDWKVGQQRQSVCARRSVLRALVLASSAPDTAVLCRVSQQCFDVSAAG